MKKAKVVIADREHEEANLKKLQKIVVSNDGLVSSASAVSAILNLTSLREGRKDFALG